MALCGVTRGRARRRETRVVGWWAGDGGTCVCEGRMSHGGLPGVRAPDGGGRVTGHVAVVGRARMRRLLAGKPLASQHWAVTSLSCRALRSLPATRPCTCLVQPAAGAAIPPHRRTVPRLTPRSVMCPPTCCSSAGGATAANGAILGPGLPSVSCLPRVQTYISHIARRWCRHAATSPRR